MLLTKLLSYSWCNFHQRRTICIAHNLFKNTNRLIVKTKPKNNHSYYSTEQAFNVNTKVTKDVILFKYDNPKFFKMLNIFAICQFGFWSYLSISCYSTLRDIPVQKNVTHEVWWRNINFGEGKYRYGLTLISFFMGEYLTTNLVFFLSSSLGSRAIRDPNGYGILAGAWIFSLKSVRYLILRKGGDAITLVTYGPFGNNRMLTVNLKYVNCKDTRTLAKTYLPLKVTNQYFHYLLDMKGEFKNTKLFDYTAGLKRAL